MPVERDVVVVGGGLAGITAALTAARSGADVGLVSHKRSTLHSASGLVDVLGYAPDGRGPLTDPFEAIPDLPGGHPYERAGEAPLREGLALFDDVTGDRYRGGHTTRNALVPTVLGAVKPTARYPAAVAPGLASDARDALLVGFESHPDVDAPLAAANLREVGVPFDVRGVAVDFPAELGTDALETRLARALDADEPADDGLTMREALAARVRPHLEDAERVGFPPVLGERRPASVRATLAEELGAAVFEVPAGPPSLPGRRLERRLHGALERAGVAVRTGEPVVDFAARGDRVQSVDVDRQGGPVTVRASAFVLATGGLVGKGLVSDRESVTEPVFDCHVPHPADRYDWFADEPFGDHAFARFGVDVDREMRPRTASGDAEFANLRAAGAVLGGCDFAAEKSGGGVSLSTGYAAGRRAAEGVS